MRRKGQNHGVIALSNQMNGLEMLIKKAAD
jgi:hypothetical protein